MDCLNELANDEATTNPTVHLNAQISSPKSHNSKVWVLLGPNAGDNAQIIHLASTLKTGYLTIALHYNWLYPLPAIVKGNSLSSIKLHSRSAIQDAAKSGWPQVVIACGPRSVPILRWLKSASAGRTKVIICGRPRAPLHWFDLVITTPQYRLPQRSNVLSLPLPMARFKTTQLQQALMPWREHFAFQKQNIVGVLLGGNTWPYRYDTQHAHRIGRYLQNTPGYFLITSSRRTPEFVLKIIQSYVQDRCWVYDWRQSKSVQFSPRANPYRAILAASQRLLVTGDSAMMMAEANASAKPFAYFPLPKPHWFSYLLPATWALRWQRNAVSKRNGFLVRHINNALAHLIEWGMITPQRDFEALHELINQQGLSQCIEFNHRTRINDSIVVHNDLITAAHGAVLRFLQ
ncbi:MAG: mitochondrial fission ELM1 family protein [Xanthomonadales bacterium]|nr:mitochondrial fission ELM1 family protein [Xanthomonadales bacterium]